MKRFSMKIKFQNKSMNRILIRAFLLAIMMLTAWCMPAQQTSDRSIAIVLKLTGNKTAINNSEVYSYTVFNGVAKNLSKNIPSRTQDVLKIKALDENNNLIYEGFYENPLNQKLESFEENGEVNNNILPSTSGYVNLRFPLPGNNKSLTIITFSIQDNKETIATTLKFNIQ